VTPYQSTFVTTVIGISTDMEFPSAVISFGVVQVVHFMNSYGAVEIVKASPFAPSSTLVESRMMAPRHRL